MISPLARLAIRAAAAPLILSLTAAASAAPPWRDAEAPALQNHVQLTFPSQFVRAGEAYFSPDARWIIFQAIPADAAGEPAAQHYEMYVSRLARNDAGQVTGLEETTQISPSGAASTCGYFHPLTPWRVIFGSTIAPPSAKDTPGYQRGQSRYVWQFPTEMEVVTRTIPRIFEDMSEQARRAGRDMPQVAWGEDARTPVPLWKRPGYDAECAYSPDARFIIYTSVDDETRDPDIHVFDTASGESRALVVAPGYDGGPFFSPDGRRICYRSDRARNDLLQVFVADLEFDDSGAPVGVLAERQLTDNEHVNWAPFWHPSGEFLVYTTSEIGHDNYEVFAITVPPAGAPIDAAADIAPPRRQRITNSSGFDGLPVFSADGALMMWTSSRAGVDAVPPAQTGRPAVRTAPQVWIADFVADRP